MITSMGGEDIKLIKRKQFAETATKALRKFEEVESKLKLFSEEYLKGLVEKVMRPYFDITGAGGLYNSEYKIDSACYELGKIPKRYDDLIGLLEEDLKLPEVFNSNKCGILFVKYSYHDIKEQFKSDFNTKEKFRNRISKRIGNPQNFSGLRKLVSESLKFGEIK